MALLQQNMRVIDTTRCHLHHRLLPAFSPRSNARPLTVYLPSIFIHETKNGRLSVLPVRMGLKEVQSYDASFELKPECEEKLHSLLNSAAFRSQVSQQVAQQSNSSEHADYEFMGELFQPVPWSVTSKHGMPQEFEKYFGNADYAIINVPPNFMFQAKIFKPSRLCAIFKRTSPDA